MIQTIYSCLFNVLELYILLHLFYMFQYYINVLLF